MDSVPIIESSRFEGNDELDFEDFHAWEVRSFSEAASKVPNYNGTDPTLLVGISLTPNNDGIENSNAILLGKSNSRPIGLDARSIWNFKQDIDLSIPPFELSKFVFKGKMSSEYLDYSEFDYDLTAADKTTTSDDLISQGFRGFCLRTYLCPLSSSTAKMHILLFPLAAADMEKEHPESVNHNFPGLVIARNIISLGIQTDPSLGKCFGSPIAPLLLSRRPLAETDDLPSRYQILAAIHSLLRKTTAPECKVSSNLMYDRWAQIKRDGANKLFTRPCPAAWPVAPVEVQQGRIIYYFIYNRYNLNHSMELAVIRYLSQL